jgi:hypothetical protein
MAAITSTDVLTAIRTEVESTEAAAPARSEDA